MIYSAYKIEWTEHERGWGQRPDGTSYHKSKEIADGVIKKHNDGLPPGPAPDIYVSAGKPTLVEVSKETYNKIKKSKNGTIWKD